MTAAARAQARREELLASLPTDLFIGGQWRAAGGGERFDVHDPATGEVLRTVADASADDARAALDAAHAAQRDWARTAPRERGEILRRAFDALIARREDLALLMTLEMGKPLAESRGEVTYGAEFLRWFSEEAVRVSGRYNTATDAGSRILVLRRPVGPCLLITPWNFPLAMGTRKIGPALAAGCTVVLKPAQLTPLTSLLLAQVLADAGVPPGVVNVVPTSRAGDATGPLLADPRLRKLSFTGSTPVGRSLLSAASEQVLRTSMELGGNAPFLVFADADLDAAVDGAMAAKFRNIGEACTAGNRFLVHADVAEEFTRRLAGRVRELRMGPGTQDGVSVGPLIDGSAREKVAALVTDALEHGAELHVGGEVPDGPGSFYPATLLTGAGEGARIHREEIFGPVVSVTTFDDEAEAVARANDTEYGLIAYAFTRDLDRGLRLAEELEFGMLGLNSGVISNPAAPFGGVKASGVGREGGLEGIEEYLETTYVGIADPFR
ncbi:NAD-dependent succinate-semialdehyde dehydrogenase [Georgenia wangjunii]|uniref:NAD-dependent succinate-semialdehyde dehydrogenase n=1 Tax=Georgenia wangjunii TaxID=3117730 RepID=UPI002F26B113